MALEVASKILFLLFTHNLREAAATVTIEEGHYDIICKNILSLDCDVHHDVYVNCGNDGVTYNNSCQFAQGHCLSPSLHVLHTGACSNDDLLLQEMSVLTILNLVCDDIATIDCSTQPTNIICASDNISYTNNCFYEKARCNTYGLHVVHAGHC